MTFAPAVARSKRRLGRLATLTLIVPLSGGLGVQQQMNFNNNQAMVVGQPTMIPVAQSSVMVQPMAVPVQSVEMRSWN